jgi:catechol 2,3-dioxygenase-like lactoylglutathione lyase family enzyme
MRLEAVLEVALYHDAADGAAMTELYEDVLGLPVVARWPGGAAHRLSGTLVLLFEREGLAKREGPIADHGSVGPGHVCFTVAAGEYEECKRRVAAVAEVVHQHDWSGGRRSFYFRDPAGNLLEIADGDLWPESS